MDRQTLLFPKNEKSLFRILSTVVGIVSDCDICFYDVGTFCVTRGTASSAHPRTYQPNAGDCLHEAAGACQKAG